MYLLSPIMLQNIVAYLARESYKRLPEGEKQLLGQQPKVLVLVPTVANAQSLKFDKLLSDLLKLRLCVLGERYIYI